MELIQYTVEFSKSPTRAQIRHIHGSVIRNKTVGGGLIGYGIGAATGTGIGALYNKRYEKKLLNNNPNLSKEEAKELAKKKAFKHKAIGHVIGGISGGAIGGIIGNKQGKKLSRNIHRMNYAETMRANELKKSRSSNTQDESIRKVWDDGINKVREAIIGSNPSISNISDALGRNAFRSPIGSYLRSDQVKHVNVGIFD